MSKERLKADYWLKDAAPSTNLRKWFGHDPSKWEEFKSRYVKELEEKREIIDFILNMAAKGPITLLFSARDAEHNHAVALKDYILSVARRSGNHGAKRQS